ncbi:3-methyl-2-oxobutanoate hydroxymethyltransferase [Kineosporia sp. R_H_3]|uniref:3-methyl-2-oxobutanoate hydroxymethyltransferase n=1 Tax=Kineosporia sp. R_H_3 TaxID=1961848 RepID=UPI000B4ADAA2|nr:3-methyl-2-oxobutanoate hydroxymethyltransferase [Kineosporia sp. R_H_3]
MARPTVADLRAGKGQRQLSMLHVTSLDEAAAAHAAGIDLLSIVDPLWGRDFRSAAPDAFVCVGLLYGQLVTTEDYLRAAFAAMSDGADSVYCAASLRTVEALADEGIPVCGHSGLIPSKATWTGGFKAIGKTADTALLVHRQVKALEDAGAFAAEIEVVPDRVAAEISRRTTLLLISMGAGSGCDAQYLFAEDVLGSNTGHVPRHAKRYRDFAAEYARLQAERIAAFGEFADDVKAGGYPGPQHTVAIGDAEYEAFLAALGTN